MIRIQDNFINFLLVSTLFAATAAYAGDSAADIRQRIGSGDPAAGKTESYFCQGCHGETGMSAEDMIPNLAGQYADYIVKQIRNFRSGERTHQIMNAMSKTISDAELVDVAAYFSSQKQMHGSGTGDNPVAKNLFLNGDTSRDIPPCMSCHGENGKGQAPNISTYPVIGGQRKGYLRAQLMHWRSGERSNSPDGVMNNVAKKLTDSEIEALTNYISGL
jgi:cytochrome c553